MQSRPRTVPGLMTALHPISVRSPTIGAEFCQAGRDVAVRRGHVNLAMIEFHVGKNHAGAEMRAIAENRIADVIEMRHLRFIEDDAVLELARVPHHHAVARR